MENKMQQKSGNDSKNIQVGGNVTIGISAAEARQIAIDVFKANFYEFSENAAKKALKRAEEITDNFIEQFYQNLPHLEEKLQEPAIQSTLFNTQKEYAKSGSIELKEQLLDLLLQRIDSEESSLKRIVLDEAISILPKLTKEQINFLSLIFSAIFLNHRDILDIKSFENFINNKIIKFYPATTSYSFLTHLQFTGCCTILSAGSTFKPLEQIFSNRYKALFTKGFTKEDYENEFGKDSSKLSPLLIRCLQNPIAYQFNLLNDEAFKSKIKDLNLGELGYKALSFQTKYMMNNDEIKNFLVKKNGRMKQLMIDWKENDFKSIRLTSVGFAIAVINYNKKCNEKIDVDSFI